MVTIRLQRLGARNQPFYRIVVMDKRERRNGRPIETLGTYNPLTDPETVVVNRERFKHWVDTGAQMTDAIAMLVLKEKRKKARLPARQAKPPKSAQPKKQEALPVAEATQPKASTPDETPIEGQEAPRE